MPAHGLLSGTNTAAARLVRTEPIQGRSAARIDALLDAAADVVDEVGFDRLTTAMVAERAEASIGTLYRYFPDRIVLLQALRDRVISRYRARVVSRIRTDSPKEWWEAVDSAIQAFVDMFREEPGYRIVRFSDEERVSNDDGYEYHTRFFAERFAEILSEEFGLPPGDDLAFHLGIAAEVGFGLISHAFMMDSGGDERTVDEARAIVRMYMEKHYGNR